jgi:hypothetical protein
VLALLVGYLALQANDTIADIQDDRRRRAATRQP